MVEEGSAPQVARIVRWGALLETALVLCVFVVNSAWPVPDANEPYYLAKARHFWDPGWGGPGSLFLDSGNAHAVFYLLFGWICRALPLAASAWVIRGMTWILLAWGWRRLSRAAVGRPGMAVLSAALLVAANGRFDLAGEWIVGGAEAKGFAYVLVFLALERLLRGDWSRVWPWLGLATSFHVLVGGWSFAAAGMSWLCLGSDRPPVRSQLRWLGLGGLLAVPGLGAALMLNGGADAVTLGQAARIMVFERAAHHLSPLQFSGARVVRYLVLLGGWLVLVVRVPPTPAQRRLRGFVAWAVGFAAAGVAAALATHRHPDLEARILQLYWFRLSDAAVPVGVSLGLVAYAERLRAVRPRRAFGLVAGLGVVGGLHLVASGVAIAGAKAPRGDWTVVDPPAWREACRWVADHTPADARFLTPRGGGTFTWYSNRRDVVNWKDVPQDARGVVEWWRRMREIHGAGSPSGRPRWRRSLGELGADRLRELGRRYSAEYAIVVREPGMPSLPFDAIHANRSYLVLRLVPPTGGGG